jgi:undecaprenyl-diphosphatase
MSWIKLNLSVSTKDNKDELSEVNLYHNKLLLLAFLSLAAFISIAWLVTGKEVANIDHYIKEKISQLKHPAIEKSMRFITKLCHPGVLFFISLLVALIFIIHQSLQKAFILIIGVGGSIVLQFLIKQIFERTRPVEAFSHDLGYSFPSGHATTATVFFLLMSYLFSGRFTNVYSRILFISVNNFLFLLVGFSRIYLHLHWTSDVTAGIMIGCFWTSVLLLTSIPISSVMSLPNDPID